MIAGQGLPWGFRKNLEAGSMLHRGAERYATGLPDYLFSASAWVAGRADPWHCGGWSNAETVCSSPGKLLYLRMPHHGSSQIPLGAFTDILVAFSAQNIFTRPELS